MSTASQAVLELRFGSAVLLQKKQFSVLSNGPSSCRFSDDGTTSQYWAVSDYVKLTLHASDRLASLRSVPRDRTSCPAKHHLCFQFLCKYCVIPSFTLLSILVPEPKVATFLEE